MSPTRKKQTARKTTGKHFLLSSTLRDHSPVPAAPPPPPPAKTPKPRPRRRPTSPGPTTTNNSRPRPRPKPSLKSILKNPKVGVSTSASNPAVTVTITSLPGIPSRNSLNNTTTTLDGAGAGAGPSASVTATVNAPGPALASGPVIHWRRPLFEILDEPIGVCTRFATWLENQNCAHDDTLLGAIERDGSHFLSLAKATVMFDNALRGIAPSAENGVTSPLGEHARTLRVFAALLKTKLAEGNLSKELETAVLRDGEPLLRLALCCLEFDKAIGGSGGTVDS